MINKYRCALLGHSRWLLYVCLFTAITTHANEYIGQNNPHFTENAQVVDVDLLSIDNNITTLIDQHLAGATSTKDKAERLHQLLFSSHYQNIIYQSGGTKTAQQVFDTKSGNCVGLSSLFVAAARYAGLDAYYQSVNVPTFWQPYDSYYVVPGHINVGIFGKPQNINRNKRKNQWVYVSPEQNSGTRSNRIAFRNGRNSIQAEYIVEFLQIYSAKFRNEIKLEIIEDSQAKAEYYNNIAIDYLANNELDAAISLLQHSINLDGTIAFTWSNLGFAYKKLGKMDKAESAYLHALKLDKKNISATKNLYLYYLAVEDLEKARKYKKKVERYNLKNPYYHAKLAQINVASKRYSIAIKQLKKALRIKPDEDSFHYQLAQIYFETGNLKQTKKHLRKAEQITSLSPNKVTYHNKLEALDQLMR